MHIDKEGRLIDIGMNLGTQKSFNHYLEMLFMKKDLFLEIIRETIESGEAHYFKEALLARKDRYKINTYEFKGHVDYIRDIKTYYEANFNLLKKDVSMELFFEGGTIYTKTKDEPSTLYKETANVQNSLIANGCVIEGNVDSSIIFRGVKIGKMP